MAVDVLDRLGLLMLPRDYDTRDPAASPLGLLSQPPPQDGNAFFDEVSASEFRSAISRLSRCGHARFRRAPGGSSHIKPPEASSLQVSSPPNVPGYGDLKVQTFSIHESSDATTPNLSIFKGALSKNERSLASLDAMGRASMTGMDQAHVSTSKMEQTVNGSSCRMDDAMAHSTHDLPGITQRHHAETMVLQPPTATGSSFISSLSMEGCTVTNTTFAKQSISSGRPPLPPKKRKPVEQIEEPSQKHHRSRTCHCRKHRKSKGTRVVRMSAIGLKAAEIPADGHSWCKYGQKSTKESSTTRGYYRCSSFNGCPARKYVERAVDDPNVFMVTYGRDHVHFPSPMTCT